MIPMMHRLPSQRLKQQPSQLLTQTMTGTFFLVVTVGVSVVGGGAFAAIAIGLVLGIVIYAFGSVSGGLFNPAVTLAVWLSGRQKLTSRDACFYIIAQCVGGVLGSLVALGATEKSFFFDYEATHSFKASALLEITFTFLLCLIVLTAGTSKDAPNHYFGFAIGLSVTAGAFASGGFDQGSFNPAVTFGINVANSMNSEASSHPSFGAWVLFLLAPLLGATLAAGVFRATRGGEYEELPVAEKEANSESSSKASKVP